MLQFIALEKFAFERSYDPKVSRELKDEYFTNAPCSGRPKVITEESSTKVLELVQADRQGREKTAQMLVFEAGMSDASVL